MQTSNWTPIYSQEVFICEDMMRTHISHPKNKKLSDEKIVRSGKLNLLEINYFDPENKTRKLLKKYYPYFY